MPPSRVAIVFPVDVARPGPAETLERWPLTPRLAAELAGRGHLHVEVFWRSRGREATLVRDGVAHHFVDDGSRAGTGLARAVRRVRPTVVHVQSFIYPAVALTLGTVLGRRVRLVVQHHGEPPGGGRTRWLQTLAGRRIDGALFTGAEGQAEPWRAAGILPRSTPCYEVLEAPSDLEPGPVGAARSRTAMRGQPAVLWVGRLVEGKDPATAVAAFASFAEMSPGARLYLLCGERPLEAVVRALIAADPRLVGRVELAGPVAHAAMADWYSGADLFLSTSRHEGSGFALIEALTCGVTPVISDLAPHRAIAGPLGKRFLPGDAAAAAMALAAAWAERDRGAGRGRAAVLAHAREQLGWDAVVHQLLLAYGLAGEGR